MFENLVDSRPSAPRRTPMTLAISMLTHGALAAALILVPLFQNQVLPRVQSLSRLSPPEASSRNAVELAPAPARAAPAIPAAPADKLIAPTAIPEKIAIVIDSAEAGDSGFLPPLNEGRGSSSLFEEIFRREAAKLPAGAAPPPPPPPPPPAVAPPPPAEVAPVRRGGGVVKSNLIHQVLPVYSPLAKAARVEGIVVLEAVITKEGAIDSLRVVSGHPLLRQSALDAVAQWRYKPTLLNGEPVAVITTVTVSFSFN